MNCTPINNRLATPAHQLHCMLLHTQLYPNVSSALFVVLVKLVIITVTCYSYSKYDNTVFCNKISNLRSCSHCIIIHFLSTSVFMFMGIMQYVCRIAMYYYTH